MLKSKFYKTCKASKKAASGVIFAETTPKRMSSYIPFANFIGQEKHGDNNWVSIEKLADGKTFVGTTDTNIKVEMDLDTMEAGEWIKWDDKLSLLTGVSHSQTHSDGSVISIGYTMEYTTGKL